MLRTTAGLHSNEAARDSRNAREPRRASVGCSQLARAGIHPV